MKIGIFGGTFNPPHKGHVRMVNKMAEELELDKVIIIPNKVELIGDNAFENCSNLTMVEMSKKIEFIGKKAFKNCTPDQILIENIIRYCE